MIVPFDKFYPLMKPKVANMLSNLADIVEYCRNLEYMFTYYYESPYIGELLTALSLWCRGCYLLLRFLFLFGLVLHYIYPYILCYFVLLCF